MATWIEKINKKLETLGLFPALEAAPVIDAKDHLVLIDSQEVTVYAHHEGVSRGLSLVKEGDDPRETFEAVFQALQPNVVEMDVIEEDGVWHRNWMV